MTIVKLGMLHCSKCGLCPEEARPPIHKCFRSCTVIISINFDANFQQNNAKNASNITIRSSYYIYCRRNKQWTCPDLLNFQ